VPNIIIVTGRGKSAIEDHFDVSFELEHLLETRNKKDLLATVRAVSDMINVAYIRQKEALGLGHAVLRARELVAGEPFAVILSDDVIDAEVPCLRQLIDVYEFYGAPVLALMEVPKESISAYGVVDAEPIAHNGGRDRPLSDPQPGRETESERRTLQPRHHRPLRTHARDFPFHRKRPARERRRNPAHRRLEAHAA
jgi:UTP--glucose-1-phosphate uridylyltransferase